MLAARPRTLALGTLLVMGLASAACDDDGGGTVEVTLQEFAITLGSDSAPAGDVTFNVENVGPNDPHEFVVFRTDLAPDALPTAEDGSVDEAGEGVELIDEIEDIAVGATPTLTVPLDPGNYVFICNIVEEEEGALESHYQEGMRISFTVE